MQTVKTTQLNIVKFLIVSWVFLSVSPLVLAFVPPDITKNPLIVNCENDVSAIGVYDVSNDKEYGIYTYDYWDFATNWDINNTCEGGNTTIEIYLTPGDVYETNLFFENNVVWSSYDLNPPTGFFTAANFAVPQQYTPPRFDLIGTSTDFLGSVGGSMVAGVVDTGQNVWPLLVFLGVTLAFIIAAQLVVFTKRSVGSDPVGRKKTVIVEDRDARAYRRGKRDLEKVAPSLYKDE